VPVDLYDVQYSPRFAYVPQFIQTIPPTGTSSNLNIGRSEPSTSRTYTPCTNPCAVDFAPGPWNTSPIGNSNQNAEAMTAWVFPDGMLPVTLRGNPAAIGQNTYVQLVQ